VAIQNRFTALADGTGEWDTFKDAHTKVAEEVLGFRRYVKHKWISNAKRSFYRSFNAIFGRVNHIASEAVIVELLNSKCLPTLLYGLEACPLKSADLKSLDYTVFGAFMKIFKTKSKEVASCCMEMFNCSLPSVSVNNRKCKFLQKKSASENIICRHCVDCAK